MTAPTSARKRAHQRAYDTDTFETRRNMFGCNLVDPGDYDIADKIR